MAVGTFLHQRFLKTLSLLRRIAALGRRVSRSAGPTAGFSLELEADFDVHCAREVEDIAVLVDLDIRVELPVAAETVEAILRVVLEIEGVQQIRADRELRVSAQREF